MQFCSCSLLGNSLWPQVALSRTVSYFAVAGFAAVVYDWVSTLGQEIELIWRQRWSLVTFLYLSLRYIGMLYSVVDVLTELPTFSLTDVG